MRKFFVVVSLRASLLFRYFPRRLLAMVFLALRGGLGRVSLSKHEKKFISLFLHIFFVLTCLELFLVASVEQKSHKPLALCILHTYRFIDTLRHTAGVYLALACLENLESFLFYVFVTIWLQPSFNYFAILFFAVFLLLATFVQPFSRAHSQARVPYAGFLRNIRCQLTPLLNSSPSFPIATIRVYVSYFNSSRRKKLKNNSSIQSCCCFINGSIESLLRAPSE